MRKCLSLVKIKTKIKKNEAKKFLMLLPVKIKQSDRGRNMSITPKIITCGMLAEITNLSERGKI